MAGTVIEYLKKYGDIPFREKPLNDVDSLALCQLSYLKFDGMVSDVRHNGPSVTLQEIAKRPDVEQLFGDVRFEKENRALFEGLLSGRRFRNMKLNCYINLVEKEWETQFSAITFILDDGTLFLAFRGTDETIVGWKEDFNMAFLNPVPGQEYSVKYVNNPSRPSWEPKVEQTVLDIYAGNTSVDDGIQSMQDIVTEAIKEG